MIEYPNVKVNVGLNVLKKREDGYHDIETLFLPSSEIHDVLEIVPADGYSETISGLCGKYGSTDIVQGISPDGRLMITIARKGGVDWNPLADLSAKAYALFSARHNLPSVKIYLEKLSPVGAGLGGGSSDAAFTLKMLNEMFSVGLTEEELAGYAAELGSDCPFFIYNRPMIGRGRGEILVPYDFRTDLELKIIVPEGIAVPTAEAYRGIKPEIPEMSLEEVLEKNPEEWKTMLKNDFEAVVFRKYPELEALKKSLYDSGAVYASMSGSGSAFFALYTC